MALDDANTWWFLWSEKNGYTIATWDDVRWRKLPKQDMPYASPGADLSKVLHGAARLHIALGRMCNAGVSTRGWSYNDLVADILAINGDTDPAGKMRTSIDTLFDTLDAMTEIGPDAVKYLGHLREMLEVEE